MALNKAVVMGRLGKEPELRRTQSGIAVCSVSLAVDRDFKGEDGKRETDWIDCVMWRSTAEFFCKYFHKGDNAIVSGRLQMRKWTDKNGQNRTALEIQADNVYFGGNRGDTSNTADESQATPEASFEEESDDGTLPF